MNQPQQFDLLFAPPPSIVAPAPLTAPEPAPRPSHVTICRVRQDGSRIPGSERQGEPTEWTARTVRIRYPSYDDEQAMQSSLFRCAVGAPSYGQRIGDDRENGVSVMAVLI